MARFNFPLQLLILGFLCKQQRLSTHCGVKGAGTGGGRKNAATSLSLQTFAFFLSTKMFFNILVSKKG